MRFGSRRVRRTILRVVLCSIVLGSAVGLAGAANETAGNDATQQLQEQIGNIGNFLSIVVVAVAAPNAAYGLFEYMTAGTDAESTQQGKRRIRNSFIAAGGAALIQVAVRALSEFITV